MGARRFDPLGYWEERHAKFANDHRNVGNMTLSPAQNTDLLFSKAITLSHALGRCGTPRGARILDAGCGAGVITELLRLGGFDMTGCDTSPTAIAAARAASKASYEVATLAEFSTTAPFDVVLCADVLFHVIDDSTWAASVRNLVTATRPGGLLLIIEYFADFGQSAPAHVRWRSQAMYEGLFAEEQSTLVEASQLQYPHEGQDKTLLVVRRAGAAL